MGRKGRREGEPGRHGSTIVTDRPGEENRFELVDVRPDSMEELLERHPKGGDA